MEFMSRVGETIPAWKAGGFLIFTAVSIWLPTSLDRDSRRYVELQREWWGSTSPFESEFKKVGSRGLLGYLIFIALSLICAW
jgi:hypothetical protein